MAGSGPSRNPALPAPAGPVIGEHQPPATGRPMWSAGPSLSTANVQPPNHHADDIAVKYWPATFAKHRPTVPYEET
jgi:hypothetical protein